MPAVYPRLLPILLLMGGLVVLLAPPLRAGEPFACYQAATPKFIDGRFNDWHEPFLTLDGWCWRAAERKAPVYGGPRDLSATVRLAWDADNLYVAIAVLDDIYFPVSPPSTTAGDLVILRIGPPDDSATPCELVLAPSPTAAVLKRTAAGALESFDDAPLGFARSVLPAPIPPLPHEEGKRECTNLNKLWYECAIPWASLPKMPVAAGKSFSLEVQIQDDDGQGVRGCLRWHGARGEPQTKDGLGMVQFAPPCR